MRAVVGVARGSPFLGKKPPMLGTERGYFNVYGIFYLPLPACYLPPATMLIGTPRLKR